MTHSWPAQIDSVVLRLLLSLHQIVHLEADEYQQQNPQEQECCIDKLVVGVPGRIAI
jgi:hypothetical protein